MIFNYIKDLQAAGKKEKDDDRIVLNRNILTQNCSNLVKGIKDLIFFNTELAHTCTIQSRIRPKIQWYMSLGFAIIQEDCGKYCRAI